MRVSLLAVGSRGDVQPLVALGAELRKRGHPVRLATHDEFQPLVDEAGLDYSFLPGGPSAIPAKANSPLKLFRALVRYLNQIAPELATQTRIACQDADLVVDNALSHTSAVESLSAPWCMVLYQPLMPTSAFPAPGLPTLPLGPAYNRLTHIAAYSLQQQPLNRLLGLAPKQIRFPWRTVGLNRPALFAFSPTVIAPPADWPPSCHVTGYWFWNRSYEPPSEVLNLLQKGTPPIALTLGSMWPFAPVKATELAAQGASRLGHPLIVIGGPDQPAADSVIHLTDVDHGWLFPQVAAVIHHGGAGTTAAALRAGVPQIIAPFFADQRFWAARAHALGVAPESIPLRRLTKDHIEAALATALGNQTMSARAAQVGLTVQGENGVEQACRVLERWQEGASLNWRL